MADLYITDKTTVNATDMLTTARALHSLIATNQDYIYLLTEFLKPAINVLKQEQPLTELIDDLNKMAFDQQYESRLRFMLQDLIELYKTTDDD